MHPVLIAPLFLFLVFAPSQPAAEEEEFQGPDICHDNYLLMQAHHDHCDHHDLPTAIEITLHDFEHYYEDCFIKRQYDDDAEACPAVDCSDSAAMEAAIATLEDTSNDCENSCASTVCKNAIQLILMAHDTCDEGDLPYGVETELHHFEEPCEDELCNTADAPFDPYDADCTGGGHRRRLEGDGFEWAGIFSVDSASLTWTMAKKNGAYADPSMKVVIVPTATPTEATMHSLEAKGSELIKATACTVIAEGETMDLTAIAAGDGQCFDLQVAADKAVSSFGMTTTGIAGFAAYTAHSPYEFEADAHYLKDAAGGNVEHVAEEGGGGHAHDHAMCVCEAQEHDWVLECSATAKIQAAVDYLESHAECKPPVETESTEAATTESGAAAHTSTALAMFAFVAVIALTNI